MEDGDLVHMKGGGWGIFNVDADDHARHLAVPRLVQRLEGRLDSVRKGDYEHFMQKEIFEQPESIAATMRGRVKRVRRPPLIPSPPFGAIHIDFRSPSLRVSSP